MCRPRTKPIVRSRTRPIAAGLAAIALGTTLAGCSDLYFDRRDTVALGAGDAIAANEVAQTIDPWPAHSGNTSLAFNGQKMQTAVERYRTNTPWVPVTPVINPSQPTAQAVPPTQQTLSVQPGGASTVAVPGIGSGASTTTTTVVTAAPTP